MVVISLSQILTELAEQLDGASIAMPPLVECLGDDD